MSAPILATKLYIPPPRPKVVLRPRLIERLNEGLRRPSGVTLISASAGFGKTTLLSEWIHQKANQPSAFSLQPFKVAWLSLDEGDSDPVRFLTYLIVALQTIAPNIGMGILGALQTPQPPSTESTLTILLNEITSLSDDFILVLDDYHLIDATPVDQALNFLLEHLPPQLHPVIASREDPPLPLARLRVQGQLTELRAADLSFTPAEATEFLNQVMGLNLSAENITALEHRTEGWIAGLQLAALALQGMLSMPGQADTASFIQSFTGSHHFVLDYLIEEVLQQQSESVQTFLLRTSILDRLCSSLCEAVLRAPGVSGEETLAYLEHANLFVVPLDNERRWYRYHHLFRDLLRKRLGQSLTFEGIAELHVRASQWFEDQGLELEAFQHATAANDIERAERLMADKRMPRHFRGAANVILEWLASLPKTVMDARPRLWVRYATMSLVAGQTTGVEERLRAAEAALQGAELNHKTRDLIGQIACARATLALTRYDPETMIAQARRALEYLLPDDLTFCFTANWILANAYMLQGDRAAASLANLETISISQKSEDMFSMILATGDLGQLQEMNNQLYQAAEAYRRVLQLGGEYPQPNIAETYLGLARIYYEWNELRIAEQYGQQSLELSRQYDRVIDRFIVSEIFLARLKLAQGDVNGAAAILAQADRATHQQNFVLRMPEVAGAQVLVLLQQGDVAAAARLAQTYNLPISQARIFLAQRDPSQALAVLEPLRQRMEAKDWADESLKVMVLQAVAFYMHGEKDRAVRVLGDALALAEPGGFIRLFVDEGEPMRFLIFDFRFWIEKQGHHEGQKLIGYTEKILAAFPPTVLPQSTFNIRQSTIVEPLSPRELEILQLIAQGLSNREISERLFLALDTVKGHNRRIFDKLQVQRRTEAIARARELGLL